MEATMTHPKLAEILKTADCVCTKAQIDAGLDRLAKDITAKLKDTNPLILCVMVGAVIPAGHLLTRLAFPLEVDYIHATRYRGEIAGGELYWRVKPHTSLKGRTVLIVDDIFDGGLTLAAIIKYCHTQEIKAVMTAVMVNKIRQREPGVNFEPEFVGVELADRFLFGFGLDYHGEGRNLPEIFAMKE